MKHDEYRKTLDEIFKYDALEGVVGYFTNHEKLPSDEARHKAAAWGYSPHLGAISLMSSDEFIPAEEIHPGDEEKFEASLARASSSNDEVTLEELPKEEKSFFNKLFGI